MFRQKCFKWSKIIFFLRNFGLDLKKWPQERLGVPPDRHTHFRPKTEDKRKIFYKKRKKKIDETKVRKRSRELKVYVMCVSIVFWGIWFWSFSPLCSRFFFKIYLVFKYKYS